MDFKLLVSGAKRINECSDVNLMGRHFDNQLSVINPVTVSHVGFFLSDLKKKSVLFLLIQMEKNRLFSCFLLTLLTFLTFYFNK